MNTNDWNTLIDFRLFEVKKVFNELEQSYKESQWENELLWQVLMEFGDEHIWKKIFLAITETYGDRSFPILLKRLEGLLTYGKHAIAYAGLRYLLTNDNKHDLSDLECVSLGSIIEAMFTVVSEDYEDQERMIIDLTDWLRQAEDTLLRKTVHTLLSQHHKMLNRTITDTNSPKAILAFLHTLLLYDLDVPLKNAVSDLLDTEWPFLDADIDEKEFARFLWICAYFSMDNVLLQAATDSGRFLHESQIPEIILYKAYSETMTQRIFSKNSLEKMTLLLSQWKLFNEREKDKLKEKIVQGLQSLQEASAGTAAPNNMKRANEIWQIKNKTSHCPHCKQNQLVEQRFLVDGFGKKAVQTPRQIHQLLLTCGQCERVYAYDRMKLEMNKALEPLRCKVDLDPIEYPSNKSKTNIKIMKEPLSSVRNDQFRWPSTEVQESDGHSDRDGNFREETPLHRLGYRITGLNRGQRWDVLVHRAIPAIALKEIAYTIARNVRLRKSQTGGRAKFSYAIGEWEHDLKRLKQEYYKSNFTWPSY
ncbi:hypothetical protein [Candidatus Pristimantibacillus sp. PTI5]|uniref:hypothetical protein n=1 Tax=Candidatus Pristimantibacillus sp. PTI5 TaxID=3400422 RepID=UPI003B01C3E3